MQIQRERVQELIYGKTGRRFTQDSPILPDVWTAYAGRKEDCLPLLLTPHQDASSGTNDAGVLSVELRKRLARDRELFDRRRPAANIGYNQSTVVANLWFDELIRVALPMSRWWVEKVCPPKKGEGSSLLDILSSPGGRDRLVRELESEAALGEPSDAQPGPAPTANTPGVTQVQPQVPKEPRVPSDVLWMARVVGTIAFARSVPEGKEGDFKDWPPVVRGDETPAELQGFRERRTKYFQDIVDAVRGLIQGLEELISPGKCQAMVYSVSLNRLAASAVARSRITIKADAAARVFELSCANLSWAVIDSGIDAEHPAFRRRDRNGEPFRRAFTGSENFTRVRGTYDFTLVRYLLSLDDTDPATLSPYLRDKFAKYTARVASSPRLKATQKKLKNNLLRGKEVDWQLLVPLIEVPHKPGKYHRPTHEHGTHVAGILAGDWRAKDKGAKSQHDLCGVCPDLGLYDLRVLDDSGAGDEFNVMAALQFIRHLKNHSDQMPIHGVNLSVSIRHDVANYACGRTPVCEECERLVGNGIIVVAAAGNSGYLHYATSHGEYEGYQDMSITDPGNAEGVITVGSTHRFQPHTYGVSYFSSRGPTGDGRLKPDLVAPGEKIEAPVPGDENNIKVMDGTSMAAPHVSGAAALLIALHRELTGQPERVKEILCRTATDLGRERYFQGAGMVDVLRALQSV